MRFQILFLLIFFAYFPAGVAMGACTGPANATRAELKGTVLKPIEKTLALLLDHNSTKSPKTDEMTVEEQADKDLLAKHIVSFAVNPFPFIWVKWKELWTYAVTEGTSGAPNRVLISYEKIEGTSHIEYLCGSIVLRKLTPASTEVLQYEVAKATGRSTKDTLNGLKGTLETLQKN